MAERSGELKTEGARHPAGVDDRRGRRPRAGAQLRPDAGALADASRARSDDLGGARRVHGRARGARAGSTARSRACPSAAEIAERSQGGRGLTRPELAVLLAYGKLDLCEDVVIAVQAPDDPHFFETLKGYFPKALAPFEDEMRRHRLRREIIATVLANDMVNLCGPTFPRRLMAAAGCDTAELVVGFEAAREVLGFGRSWRGSRRSTARRRRRPDRPVPRARLRAARPDLLAGPPRGARACRGRRRSPARQDGRRPRPGRHADQRLSAGDGRAAPRRADAVVARSSNAS